MKKPHLLRFFHLCAIFFPDPQGNRWHGAIFILQTENKKRLVLLMKMKLLLAVAMMAVALSTSVRAVSITTGFGSIPNAGTNPYGGSGIPSDASVWSRADGLPGNDTLTLAMAATPYKNNPMPLNNGVSTYYVLKGAGTDNGRTSWNFGFYGKSEAGLINNYDYSITIFSALTGLSTTFNPAAIPDNAVVPNYSGGNSESLDFSVFGAPIGYNKDNDDTFTFTLQAFQNQEVVNSVTMTVVHGEGAPNRDVPDGGMTFSMLGAGVIGLAALRRRK
jgi:hypothetical protein